MLKIYGYKNCDTCRKALRFLDRHGISYTSVPIRETPPAETELRLMLAYLGGDRRKLFNVSGQDYRALGLKDRLPGMSDDEAVHLLAQNGNLVKRPFVLSDKTGWVGFDELEWKEALGLNRPAGAA